MVCSIHNGYPWNLCLIKDEWEVLFFLPKNWLFSIVVSLFKSKKIVRIQHVSSLKNDDLNHFVTQIEVGSVQLWIEHVTQIHSNEGSLDIT